MEKAVPVSCDSRPDSSIPRAAECGACAEKLAPTIAQLVADHHAAVYRYAYRLTGAEADAEDLAQQAFLLAQQRLTQLREADRAGGWLLTIVRNCFLKSRRHPAASLEPFQEEQLAAEVVALPDWIDPERLQQALDRLPSEARAIVVLFFFEDCSYKEIADSLQIPLGTVMSRLSRAKSKLREELGEVLPGADGAVGKPELVPVAPPRNVAQKRHW
jgi:RNA polymerase sigma-70 factor (ECF subfamily)